MGIRKIEELDYITVVNNGMALRGDSGKYFQPVGDDEDVLMQKIPYMRDNDNNWLTDDEMKERLKQMSENNPALKLSDELLKVDRTNEEEVKRVIDKYRTILSQEQIKEIEDNIEKMKTHNTFEEHPTVLRVYKLIEDAPFGALGQPLYWSVETTSYYYEYVPSSWIYKADRKYPPEEVKLMILELEDKERQNFERLKKKHSLSDNNEEKPKREAIPEEVRVAVWRRDEGKCSKCGNREKLEYDHIIPVSKGGSYTVRNIELLCEHCNRQKKDNIQ